MLARSAWVTTNNPAVGCAAGSIERLAEANDTQCERHQSDHDHRHEIRSRTPPPAASSRGPADDDDVIAQRIDIGEPLQHPRHARCWEDKTGQYENSAEHEKVSRERLLLRRTAGRDEPLRGQDYPPTPRAARPRSLHLRQCLREPSSSRRWGFFFVARARRY